MKPIDEEPIACFPNQPGHEALLGYFGLSYASWLTLPRVFMQAIPDDWQARMAALLYEYSDTWGVDESVGFETRVQAVRNGRLQRMPEWVGNYRHPDRDQIDSFRRKVASTLDGVETPKGK
ncbi:MAG: hypothetical protein ACRCV9_15530 [Burkholderiaceae bacterium]